MNMQSDASSRLQLSLRWRITLPFLLLALALALGSAYLIIRLLRETAEDRFVRQLANSGQIASDTMVRVETELLGVERLVANTEGVLEATVAEDAETLRSLVLPVVVNAGSDVAVIVNEAGISLLSIRRQPGGGPAEYETVRGEAIYSTWPAVIRALAGETGADGGDKQVGMTAVQVEGETLYGVFVSGPLQLRTGRIAGAVIVGEYLSDISQRMGEASGANISIYSLLQGEPLATTFDESLADNLTLPDAWAAAALTEAEDTPVRPLELAQAPYREALTPFTARGGNELLGVMGASLLDTTAAEASNEGPALSGRTVQLVVGFGALGLLAIGIAGLAISNSITRPLVDIAAASSQVARGNLDVEIPERGGGEVTVVARSFNQMVRGLRQVSQREDWQPTVDLPPASMRSYDNEAIPVGEVERVDVVLALLDIRSDVTAERGGPAEFAQRVEQLLDRIDRALTAHRGTLVHFDGETVLAGFGLPPQSGPGNVSTMLALHAAFESIDRANRLNLGWRTEGAPGFELRAVVHAGPVLYGNVGTKYGLSPTPMGATVREARALLTPARQLDEGGILLSEPAYQGLAAARSQFAFGRKGRVSLGEIGRNLIVYEVDDRKVAMTEDGDLA